MGVLGLFNNRPFVGLHTVQDTYGTSGSTRYDNISRLSVKAMAGVAVCAPLRTRLVGRCRLGLAMSISNPHRVRSRFHHFRGKGNSFSQVHHYLSLCTTGNIIPATFRDICAPCSCCRNLSFKSIIGCLVGRFKTR